MFNRLKPKSDFVKNVVTLMTGTSIAQAIPIALSPILTRIYTPDDFGLFALYTGLAAILSVIATGRYELAIMLPSNEMDAANIVKLSSLISCIFSLIILIIVIFFGVEISILLGEVEIRNWLYLLPASILISGIYQSLNYWFNRKKDFKRLAKNRVIQSGFTATIQIPLGLVKVGGLGLLLGTLLGQCITLISLIKQAIKENSEYFKNLRSSSLLKLAKRYINFPKFDVPTTVLDVGASQAPNLLFTSFFSASFAGFYFLTQRVLQAPITLISASILDVFKEEAAHSYRETGNSKKIYLKTLKTLILLTVIPSFLLFIFIEDMFLFFFGNDWKDSGTFAKILIPALALRFIVNPLSFMIYIAEKQKANLILMTLLFFLIVLSFCLFNTPERVVYGISISYCFVYFIYLCYSAIIAKVI